MRIGLLGSTALIAASLSATTAMAQTLSPAPVNSGATHANAERPELYSGGQVLTLTGVSSGAGGWTLGAGDAAIVSGQLTNNIGSMSLNNSMLELTPTGVLSATGNTVRMNSALDVISNSGAIIATAGFAITSVAGGDITNLANAQITGGGSNHAAVYQVAGAGTLTNSGAITGTGATGAAVWVASGSLSLTNNSDGTLTSSGAGHAIRIASSATAVINNSGSVTGTGSGYGFLTNGGDAVINNHAGGVFETIGSGGAILGNGTGTLSVTNSGIIRSAINSSQGVLGIFGQGGSFTNLAGGHLIATGTGPALAMSSAGATTVDLQAGSTVTGVINSSGSGSRTVNIAGTLAGAYAASSGTGVDAVTLASTGSMTSANLGGGDDSFLYQGGAFSGMIDGGNGTDSFTSDLGAGVARTINLANVARFETITHLSGDLTLTGASASGAASIFAGRGLPAGTLTFNGASGLTGDIFVNGAVIHATTAGGFGTGTIHMIDPTIEFGGAGTYANAISLEVADGQQAMDPTILRNTSGGVVTLSGRIYETSGVGGADQRVTFSGFGTTILTNTANSWGGVTTIDAGLVLQGAADTISGSSIVANGVLRLVQPNSGVFDQDASGGGSVQISGLGAGQTLTLSGAFTNALGVQVLDGSALALTGSVVTTGNFSAVALNPAQLAGITSRLDNSGSISGVYAVSAWGDLNLTNSGSIAASITNFNSSGVYAADGGTIVNSGSITSGTNAIYTQGVGSVTNSGLIEGGGAASTIRLVGANSIVTNLAAGRITTTGTGSGVYLDGVGGSVLNAGSISGGNAVWLVSGGAITNSGSLTGTTGSGVLLQGPASVDNQMSGVIQGGLNGVYAADGQVQVTNAGQITGLNGSGLRLFGGGSVTNTATGQITGTGNAGVLSQGGALNLVNQGGLVGTTGVAILTTGAFDNVIDLRAGSNTSGSVLTDTGADTVTVAGLLTGDVGLGAGDDHFTLVSGGTVSGLIDGGDGVDQLSLTGGGNGTLDVGTTFNFESRVMTGAGVWTLTGSDNSAASWTIDSGTLAVSGGNAIHDFADVTLNAGAALTLLSNERIGTLNGGGSIALGGNTLFLGAGNGDSSLSGVISGSGFVTHTGSGTLTLSGANTFTGATSVYGGLLVFGASDVLADTSTLVLSGAAADMGSHSDTIGSLIAVNATLNGAGTLTAGQYWLTDATVNANLGAGVLINESGVSTLNGTVGAADVLVQGGVLNLGASNRLADTATLWVASGARFALNGFDERIGALTGTGDVDVGGGRLSFGGIDSGFEGRLSGTGSLVHTGGLFTLLGDHTIRTISNTGGELRFLATTSGGLSVSGGSLTGAGTIGGALTASSGAVIAPGLAGVQNGIGGFTAGGLTLNGAILAIDVLGRSGGNLIDQLRINGTANLTGALLSPTFQGPVGDFDFSTRYLFLQANNLVGTFANGADFTATAQEGLFWRVRYDLAPNAAVLELRELINFDPGADGTRNQRTIGRVLSTGQLEASDDFANILSLFAGLDDADRTAAFDSVSGEPLANMTTSLFSANDSFLNAMRAGLNGGGDGGEALNFVSQTAFAGGRDSDAARLGAVLGAFDPSASAARRSGGWVSAYAADQALDGKAGAATVNSRLNGFAGGYGVRHGDMSMGAAGGATRLEGEVAARQARYESDLTHAAGYVAFDDGVWTADLTASFYSGEMNSRRGVTVGAFSGQAVGDTHVDGRAILASVARRFPVNDNTMVALGALGVVSNASVDGFTETGAGGLSLQVAGVDRDWRSLQLSARGEKDYRVNGQGLRVYAGAGVMATTGDRQASGDMRFTGAPVGSAWFTVEGAETPPLAGIADLGVEVAIQEGAKVTVGYRGVFSERLQDNQLGLKLQVSW